MQLENFPKIKTNRLLLRRLISSDWGTVSYLRSDKAINKFVQRPPAETKEKAIAFITKINKGIDNQDFLYWSIIENDSAKMIGTICLWNFSKDRKEAEVGYDLGLDFQGKGYMNEALNAIIEFGFNQLELQLISAYTHRENKSSKRLLERNNFKVVPEKTDEYNKANIVYEITKAVFSSSAK